MVAVLTMLLALGAVEGGSVSAETQCAQPLIFAAPQGWKARLTTVNGLLIEAYLSVIDETPCVGGGETFKIIYNDPQGFWLRCDVRLEGQTFEVWRETSAWLRFADGKTLTSSRILASVDPCGFTLLDNQKWPFVVTQKVHGYNNTVRLYVRFGEEFDLGQVVNWRLMNWVER